LTKGRIWPERARLRYPALTNFSVIISGRREAENGRVDAAGGDPQA